MKENRQILLEAGIRPSAPRVAIYGYLLGHAVHPTAEKIWRALLPQHPSLSLTTVHNTLHLFEEKQLLRSVLIDTDQVRFDATTREHAHFKCRKCGIIIDLPTPPIGETGKDFQGIIQKRELNLYGLCPACAKGLC